MKTNVLSLIALAVCILLWTPDRAFASDETDVRDVVNKVFNQLRNHDYGGLYDVLPSRSQSRMSKERFVSALERAQGIYQLDRLEMGAIKIMANLAVVDTVLYGRVTIPVQAEGKIVAQQYLIRENGQWRIATGDQSTVRKFLAANPSFAKSFKIRQPRIYVKQDSKWVEFMPPARKKRTS